MMKKLAACMLLTAAMIAAADNRLPANPAIDDLGNLAIGKLSLRWTWYAPDWSGSTLQARDFKADAGFPRRSSGRFETSGKWKGFRTAISARAADNGGIAYFARFKASPPVDTATLALVMTMPIGEPSVLIDGKKVVLPKKFKEVRVFSGKVHSLQFANNGRTITVEGDFQLLIQDDRKWDNQYYLFRLGTIPSSGKISDAACNLRIRVESPRTAPIDLGKAFNMGFSDEGTGDLRMLPPGKLSILGVSFDIVDPERNGGRSCLALSSGQKKFPAKKSVALSKAGENFRYLYLLHASARTPKPQSRVGTIVAEYADGSTKEIPVLAGRDINDQHQPSRLPNGAVAWTGENSDSFVGLYLSQFPIGGTPSKLTFKAADGNEAVWMIVGAMLGDRGLNLRQLEAQSYIVAGKDWLPLEFNGNTVAGSALDFSGYLDAPAGKYGPVIATKDGHFAFRDAPEKRIRFFGPNLIDSAVYIDKALADDFVTKATRLGYNTVRFHHFENALLDPRASDSLTFDPKALDEFDYLFAELKKHGIYLCLDLYASRATRRGDNVKEIAGRKFEQPFVMKWLIPLSESAMDNWKEFARRLLTHRNPYTGLTYAEDPALYSLNLVNENPLVILWNLNSSLIPLFEEKYFEYLKKKGLDTPENRASRGGLFIEFLNDLHINCIEEQRRFLKEELKLTALITDINMTSKFTLNNAREHLDFVDNHQYWDHPMFPVAGWQMPYEFFNSSSIVNRAGFPRYLMPVRIFGKPYTITEFNFCSPNPNRLETAPLLGGYAGLQDWDGLYRFAWSHHRDFMKAVDVPRGFDLVNDPQAQLAERIINLLFTQHYIHPAKPAFAFSYTPEQLRALKNTAEGNYPDAFTELGLYGRIGMLGAAASFPGVQKLFPLEKRWESKLPRGARSALDNLQKSGKIVSANGEIALDSKKKTLKIVAPQCEVMTFSGDMSGKVMKLSGADRYQTAALLSLDGKKLAESEKLLFIQMPNLGATKQKFANERRNLLESWGQLPILLEKCRADVELALPEMKVEALKLDGSPNGAVPSAYGNGKLRFTADTASRPGGVMVYLLTR
ncbi:hypothetical protein [Victivallis vadensis]|uniref:hypothetical protein n=1 Tax=Victivallis vadensis TaxID=172901 RepID=UPI003AF4DEF7